MIRLASLIVTLLLAACAATAPPDPFPNAQRIDSRSLEILAAFLPGTFQSIPQEKGDATQVTVRIVRIWPQRPAEHWYYEEFEKAGEEGRPYLQRLVRFGMTDESSMLMVEYALPGEPSRFAGAWRNPAAAFAGVDPRGLHELPNCRQQVMPQNLIAFAGGTIGQACRARVPAGAYEVSDFILTTTSLRTWNRGYDPAGKVVWGSQEGPLDLRRISAEAR